jgi:beta-lactamase superfamily II metal-dependent hydrolase
MRKKTRYVIQLVAIILVISLRALGQNTPSVKIIHFGATNADCSLIVIKDFDDKKTNPGFHTVTILIDTGKGNTANAGIGTAKMLWDQIWYRIRAEDATQLDYLVISHLDSDHVGNASSILGIISAPSNNYTWKENLRIIDRLAFNMTAAYSDPKISEYRLWDIPSTNAKPVGWYQAEYMAHYGKRTDKKKKKFDPQRRLVFYGQDLLKLNTQYTLKNTQMICVASDGVIGDTRKAEPKTNSTTGTAPKGENDLSFAFILRFGSFRYYTGGDIDDADGETAMEDYLTKEVDKDWKAIYKSQKFHVCAMKVNHHGTKFGTKPDFVELFDPKIAVFSSGMQQFSKDFHPSKDAISRLDGAKKICNANPPSNRQQLFTFRIRSGNKNDANPMEKLTTSDKWKNLGIQDVVLYVKEETDGRPLNDLPPKIYMFRLWRLKGDYRRLTPTITRPPIPPGYTIPATLPEEFAYDPGVITCDRVDDCTNKKHSVLPLPEKPVLVKPGDLSLISLLRLFLNQP